MRELRYKLIYVEGTPSPMQPQAAILPQTAAAGTAAATAKRRHTDSPGTAAKRPRAESIDPADMLALKEKNDVSIIHC